MTGPLAWIVVWTTIRSEGQRFRFPGELVAAIRAMRTTGAQWSVEL